MFDDYSLAKTINELENHLDMPVTDFGFEYSEEDLADIYDEAPPKDENKTEEEVTPNNENGLNEPPVENEQINY